MLSWVELRDVLRSILKQPKPGANGVVTCAYCGSEMGENHLDESDYHDEGCPYPRGLIAFDQLSGHAVDGTIILELPRPLFWTANVYEITLRSHEKDPYGWDCINPIGKCKVILVVAHNAEIAIARVKKEYPFASPTTSKVREFWTVEEVKKLGSCSVDDTSVGEMLPKEERCNSPSTT